MRTLVEGALRDGGIEVAEEGRVAPGVVAASAPERLEAVGGVAEAASSVGWATPALILVAGRELGYTRAEALDAGADELAFWPKEGVEFVAKARALLRRRRADVDIHPLSGLPGGGALRRDLQERLEAQGDLAVLGFDVRDFKAFNDRYGFARGDGVLEFVADLLEDVAMTGEIVYHIGGDDFFAIVAPRRADEFACRVIEGFDARVAGFHDEVEVANGFIPGLDRGTGAEVRFPLMRITAACATNEAADVTHVGRLAQILTELKAYGRQGPGSSYVRDRRSIHDTGASLQLRAAQREE